MEDKGVIFVCSSLIFTVFLQELYLSFCSLKLKVINEQIINFSVDRHACYMVRADELYNEVSQDASGKGASQGMFVGCFLDVATGCITFTCENKPTSHVFRVGQM